MYGLDQPRYDTVSGYGTASAPSAGDAVVTIAAGNLPAGYYRVAVDVRVDGTVGTAERDNVEVRRGGTAVRRVLVSDAADSVGQGDLYVNLSGSQALTVNAVGAATASSVYSAVISATRIS